MADAIVADHPALSGIRLVLGGNVFGWTLDQDRSFAVLDAFYEAGGRMIDTAEVYSAWVPGNRGGESETIIGAWLTSRGVRGDLRIATKTGASGAPGALRPDHLRAALAGSLSRLGTDYVDLYYAHRDDPETPLDETASGFDALVGSGQVRELGASNFTADRLAAALGAAARIGAVPYTVSQPHYNLLSREGYEGALQRLSVERHLAVFPYYGLASGFLTGKYRKAADWADTARGNSVSRFGDAGWKVLAVLDAIANETGASLARIALAWLNAQPGIAAPIASATSPEQVRDIVGAVSLELSAGQIARLDAAAAA